MVSGSLPLIESARPQMVDLRQVMVQTTASEKPLRSRRTSMPSLHLGARILPTKHPPALSTEAVLASAFSPATG